VGRSRTLELELQPAESHSTRIDYPPHSERTIDLGLRINRNIMHDYRCFVCLFVCFCFFLYLIYSFVCFPARISSSTALLADDIHELVQCQVQLRALYQNCSRDRFEWLGLELGYYYDYLERRILLSLFDDFSNQVCFSFFSLFSFSLLFSPSFLRISLH
jgi:hypothetical protein